MAQFEVLALDKTNSRARAPGAGDSYLLPRVVAVNGGTVTTSQPVLDLSQSWNAGAVTFTGIKFNVASDVSAAGSLLMDLQVGGTGRLAVRKDGAILTGNYTANQATLKAYGDPGGGGSWAFGRVNAESKTSVGYYGVTIGNSGWLSFRNGDVTSQDFGDVFIFRDAANTLAQRNGANAQTFRLYGTYPDASNTRRLNISMSEVTNAGIAVIKPEGTGTKTADNYLHISGLPTSNPGPGILWNNGGVVNVGT